MRSISITLYLELVPLPDELWEYLEHTWSLCDQLIDTRRETRRTHLNRHRRLELFRSLFCTRVLHLAGIMAGIR